MELEICISKKQPHEKYPGYIREVFREEDLLDWAKKRISERYLGEHEVVSVKVENIVI